MWLLCSVLDNPLEGGGGLAGLNIGNGPGGRLPVEALRELRKVPGACVNVAGSAVDLGDHCSKFGTATFCTA